MEDGFSNPGSGQLVEIRTAHLGARLSEFGRRGRTNP
jgi:hypothetical protein